MALNPGAFLKGAGLDFCCAALTSIGRVGFDETERVGTSLNARESECQSMVLLVKKL